MLIGAHVPPADPLAAAAKRGADAVQVFLSPPQSWKAPPPREDADDLRASPIAVYVHAPYIVNVATTSNRVRHPSRQNLQRCLDGAAAVGAAGVIVHGGHVQEGDDLEAGFRNWRSTLEWVETEVPILLENTAGGTNAMTRQIDTIARLWDVIGDVEVPLGICFDTCHAHASGEPLVEAVDRLIAATGRIDLVHCNDSKDEAGSGRDRHENLGKGRIDPGALIEVVRRAGAPVIVETPGEPDDQAADIAWLRERV